jgi:hypothetical protein
MLCELLALRITRLVARFFLLKNSRKGVGLLSTTAAASAAGKNILVAPPALPLDRHSPRRSKPTRTINKFRSRYSQRLAAPFDGVVLLKQDVKNFSHCSNLIAG